MLEKDSESKKEYSKIGENNITNLIVKRINNYPWSIWPIMFLSLIGIFRIFTPKWLTLNEISLMFLVTVIILIIFTWLERVLRNQECNKIDIKLLQSLLTENKKLKTISLVNEILKELWPYGTEYVASIIKQKIEPIIQKELPSIVGNFKFDFIDLGTKSLQIYPTKCEVNAKNSDKMTIEMNLVYDGDGAIEVLIGKILGGIENITFRGKIQLIFEPIILKPPFFGEIKITFIEIPILNFKMTGLGKLPGIGEAVINIINDLIKSNIVYPKSVTIPIANEKNIKQSLTIKNIRDGIAEETEIKKLTAMTNVGRVFLLGGESTNKKMADNIFFDIKSNNYYNGPGMIRQRKKFNTIFYKDKIFGIGGIYENKNQSYITGSVEVLELNKRRWKLLKTELYIPRHSFGCELINDNVYAIGGDNTEKYLDTVEIFDFEKQKWYYSVSMITSNTAFASCTLNNILYTIGGVNNSSLSFFDYREGKWILGENMNDSRIYCTAHGIGNNIYVVGGYNDFNEPFKSKIEIYDIRNNKWRYGSSMSTARACHSSIIIGNIIQVYGGQTQNHEILNSVEYYNINKNIWIDGPKMSIPKTFLSIPKNY
ncbi:Kelch repeat type 1 and Galactose oxidase, beta-propeller domain-containing protein [Strongyloides ratti]|uniref:Kelch repeat type 1 and Galactose oxidase, beta-propeller domain-containing protein n=1 Tax=Strongyloides ratti TaxID=34506 RepID=A0A090MXX5_STRRB|nr:Kelch repeat type 1 and Galactose oxidase, beta-propeller domain-containing protein [Strongyloides ratti]CEF66194.1 Kelch repeat type 1 and Galactose oxidase, beta-propeller domain-containing protein [Strongyloides ratti]